MLVSCTTLLTPTLTYVMMVNQSTFIFNSGSLGRQARRKRQTHKLGRA